MRPDGKNTLLSNERIDFATDPEEDSTMGPDLTDKRWIIVKGILFAFLALLSAGLQLAAGLPVWQEAALLAICIWASCRFYYFLFHCLHAYVDPGLKSAGVMDLLGRMWKWR